MLHIILRERESVCLCVSLRCDIDKKGNIAIFVLNYYSKKKTQMRSKKICKFEDKFIALTFVIAAQVKHNIVVAAYLKLLESISFYIISLNCLALNIDLNKFTVFL